MPVNRAAATIILLMVLTAPICATHVSARVVESAGTVSRESSEPSPGNLVELWRQRDQHMTSGNMPAAREALEDLQARRRLNGISSSQDLAGAFVLEGYENLELQQHGAAREAFKLAVEFDSEMPKAWLGLARTEWSSGGGVLKALHAVQNAAKSAARSWIYVSMGLIAGYWTITLGLVIAAAFLLTTLFMRNFALIHHEVSESLRRRLPPMTARTAALFLPFLPLALPYGAAWTPLFWLALMVPMLTRRERVVSLILVLGAGAAAMMAPWAAANTAISTDSRLIQVASAARGGVGPDRHRLLGELVALNPDDAVLHILHGDQARAQGDAAQAAAAYRTAMELDPGSSHAYNNAGALYFSLGRYATAISHFRQALEADPGNMEAYYNLYLAQERRFDFSAAEKTLMEGRSRDLEAMTALLSRRDTDDERLEVVEARFPVAVALDHAREAMQLAPRTTSFSNGISSSASALILPLLALGLGAWRLGSRNRPMQCHSCGVIACRQCTLHLEDAGRCSTCITLSGKVTALPRTLRERKRHEVAGYRNRLTRRSRLLAFILPGGGQLWSGRPIIGAALLTVASCGLAALLLRGMLPSPAYRPVAQSPAPLMAAGVTLLLLSWLAGWLLSMAPRFAARQGGN